MDNTGTTPLTPDEEAAQAAHAAKEGYWYRVIKGFDEELNVVTGGRLGQSMSSRIGIDAAQGDKPAEVLAKALDVVEKNHSVKAEVADEVQAQEVVDAEKKSPDLSPFTKEERSI